MISESEFNEWLSHPVTKSVREMFNARREDLRQAWEGGSFTDYEREGTVLVNVGNLGTCKGLAAFTDLTFEEYVTAMEPENAEHVGPGAQRSSSAA